MTSCFIQLLNLKHLSKFLTGAYAVIFIRKIYITNKKTHTVFTYRNIVVLHPKRRGTSKWHAKLTINKHAK